MAKKRTLKEKQHAQITRQQIEQPKAQDVASYSLKTDSSAKNLKLATTSTNSILRIDSKYIYKDLIKTLLISGILFSLLIGIYFYLGYN